MKAIKDLNLGFMDAQLYTQRGKKQMLSDVFVKDDNLERLLDSCIYYLIGEKGTGKTAYAVFLSNNEYRKTKSILKYILGTDYEKFHELKKGKLIDISGYTDIWETILLLILAKSVTDKEICTSPFNRSDLSKLLKVIDDYYDRAFSPEIIHALRITENSGIVAKLIHKNANVGGEYNATKEYDEQHLQMNLLYVCRRFADCLGKLKLKKDVILFIDGIDVRPQQIPYEEYLDCIKGLANACWKLNTGLFSNVRDSKGQFRIVLLLRPDIFNSLNLQNSTNKLVDNSVLLDWRTTYKEYPTSNLYKMACKLIAYNQTSSIYTSIHSVWEHYFQWNLESSNPEQRSHDTAFMEFLRISLSRPRDIQNILSIIRNIMKKNNLGDKDQFDYASYDSDRFQNDYSEYFLGALKDQLSFYYSEEDYKYFRKFLKYFNSPEFSLSQYEKAYELFIADIRSHAKSIPKFIEDKKAFLQFLYDCNVILAIEKGGYFSLSYREKSLTNINPEVPYGDDISYRLHFGLYKKAKMGRYRKS